MYIYSIWLFWSRLRFRTPTLGDMKFPILVQRFIVFLHSLSFSIQYRQRWRRWILNILCINTIKAFVTALTTGRVGVEKAFEKYIKFCAAHIGPLYIKSHEIYNCFSLLPQICIILNLKINGHVVFKQKLKMLIW